MYCHRCQGERQFSCYREWFTFYLNNVHHEYVTYICRNCRLDKPVFAVGFMSSKTGNDVKVWKIGQWPPYRPFVSPQVLKLIQPDRELFLQGLRAESEGMGIGAFTYYRRVVEDQKDRLFDEIINVAEKTGASAEHIDNLTRARDNFQFSKALNEFKELIPPLLLIDTHNPFTLLHHAVSAGVHKLPDEECLELATDIRTVLARLADSLSQVLRDQTEIKQAVGRILRRGQKP